MRISRRLVGALVAGTVLAGATGTLLTSTASADAPSAPAVASTEVAAVTDAVRGSEFTEGIPAAQYTVEDVRVEGDWGAAQVRPTGEDLDEATVLLRQESGAWSVVEIGSADVGCGAAPATTLDTLGLTCSD